MMGSPCEPLTFLGALGGVGGQAGAASWKPTNGVTYDVVTADDPYDDADVLEFRPGQTFVMA